VSYLEMIAKRTIPLILAFAFFAQDTFLYAGTKGTKEIRSKRESTISDRSEKNETAFLRLIKSYRAALEKIFIFHAAEDFKAAEFEELQQELYLRSAISKEAFQESMRARLDEKLKLIKVINQLEEVDILISEAEAFDFFSKPSTRSGNWYSTGSSLIRYSGFNNWNINDINKVSRFFVEKFGNPLPISAYGQSEIHDRMGFAHYNAIDVSLHPDSREGQALMEFLRSSGIPFLAFRHAVPGSATGAHIHIGKPSSRK
jgi:hypothetical protein